VDNLWALERADFGVRRRLERSATFEWIAANDNDVVRNVVIGRRGSTRWDRDLGISSV